MEGNRSAGQGAVRSGLLTGISTAAVSGSAAVLGVILARKCGHGDKTDGFFAAYGVYLGLVLVASSLRVIVLPRFVAARTGGRLGAEVGTWAAALAAPLALVTVLAVAWPHGIAAILTSNPEAQDNAARLLPWVVASAVAQIFGGLVASALAALDDYQWAAFGVAGGSVAGVVLTLALVGHGVVAFGWGLALNGALSLAIPLVPLLGRRGVGRPDQRYWSRLVELGEGIALPLALQGLYLVAYRFASGLGTGRATTFGYAYLIAAFLVAITASSVALVATVPFAREGSEPSRVAKHVLAISWVSLALVAGAAGVLALVSEQIVRRVLGASYGGGTGAELGRLVVYLAPWMVASVAVTVTYPLVFVRGRGRWLPLLAASALGAQVVLAWAAREAFGLAGVAVALALSTVLVLGVLLARLGALERVAVGLVAAVVVCGGLAALAFGLPRLVVGPVPAAILGLALYVVVLGAWRPIGLREAWAYLRTLQ
jgi:O-antigen/teichoic acid export membrane protein